jgi:hypothetical protein
MIQHLQAVIDWLKGSFDTSDAGASAKKLTSFTIVILMVWLHVKFATADNAIEFLITDGSLVLALLGVATWDKLKSTKNA